MELACILTLDSGRSLETLVLSHRFVHFHLLGTTYGAIKTTKRQTEGEEPDEMYVQHMKAQGNSFRAEKDLRPSQPGPT